MLSCDNQSAQSREHNHTLQCPDKSWSKRIFQGFQAMNLSIASRVAVVTGADSGIGFATARILAHEGATVILNDKTTDELRRAAEQLQSEISGDNRVIPITADLTQVADVTKLAEQVKSKFGGADILVHCAGIRGAAGDFLSLSDDDWLETINIDLMGAVRVCRAFIPHMQKNGWGRIVLIGSENAQQPYAEESPYNACKAAVVNLARCLSNAYAEQGLRINSVSPAFVKTPMTDAMMQQLSQQKGVSEQEAIQQFLQEKRPNIVLDRRGKPEEVAAIIAFLCSEHANFITGSNYRADGGSVATAFG